MGAKHGILIKGGDAFQAAHEVSAVIFDKTGDTDRPTNQRGRDHEDNLGRPGQQEGRCMAGLIMVCMCAGGGPGLFCSHHPSPGTLTTGKPVVTDELVLEAGRASKLNAAQVGREEHHDSTQQ